MRRIAHLSDLHFGRHEPKIVDALLQSLKLEAPDLVVVSGDLTQRARRREFMAARQFIEQANRQTVVVPGNHDLPLYDFVSRFIAPLEGFAEHITPIAVPGGFFVDAEVAILGLNTARRSKWKEGRVSLEQIKLIGEKLAPLPESILKIIVTHHPIASASTGMAQNVVERADAALRAIAAAGVHLLLSGHHHHAISGEGEVALELQHSLLVVHAGTAISTRTRGHQANSYNMLTLEQERASVTIMEWDNESTFQRRCSAAYVLDGKRWRTANEPGPGRTPKA